MQEEHPPNKHSTDASHTAGYTVTSFSLQMCRIRALGLNRRIWKVLGLTLALFGLLAVFSVAKDSLGYEWNHKHLQQNSKDAMEERQKIIGMLRHAWDGYEKYAFGKDHLLPISQTGSEWFGVGLTILDTLDTALIMGQLDIYEKCKLWISTEFKIRPQEFTISIFETNIRVVGGFLSTYSLTKDELFLRKAAEVLDFTLITRLRIYCLNILIRTLGYQI